MTTDVDTRRIGVLGGTFDPPHLAHLAIASDVCASLELDSIVFVPAGEPWQKTTSASAAQRFDMVRAAVESDARFRASRIDIDRPGPTYMVDTLTSLRAELTAESEAAIELFCIVGTDALAGLHTWHEAERLPGLATFVGVVRPGHGPNQPTLTGLTVDFVQVPSLEISSTDIRGRVSAGEPIRYLVPDAVAEYITTHYLYGRSS